VIADPTAPQEARTGALLNRSQVLRKLNRPDEAQSDYLLAKNIPVHVGQIGPNIIDLSAHYAKPMGEPLTLRGPTVGVTWSVKIHDEVADPALIEKTIVDEFEWAESLTSHWRTNTDLWMFNRTLTTNAMAVPWPVLTLSRWASEISRATDGAYDITVGPLIKLWGLGSAPRRGRPPTDGEIAAVLPAVGWQKMEVLDGMLRKQDPRMELDLSSITVGWAIDQVAQQLERRGYSNFCVEAGGKVRVSAL
jgi:FAD:protein FMN transferase